MKKMLIVEDDHLTQRTLKRIFQLTFDVVPCPSGELFKEKYFDTKFDIIIMDISLGGKLDGLTLTKLIKNGSVNQSTPILCLTAHASSKDHINAKNAGVDRFEVKPISNEMLRKIVNELTESQN